MKEQDQQKRKIAMQDQMLKQRDMMMRRQRDQDQQQQQQSWPNPIPRNTVSPVMELPSEDTREQQEDQFIGYRQPSSYNTNNEQKFLVSDDPMANINYPVIDPNASPQQIGSKISRVMSLDGNNNYQQPMPQQQQHVRQQGDDEDFSDLF